jgi:hypothetical protein
MRPGTRLVPFALLLFLSSAVLLSLNTSASDGDDVYTTIDVDFHHLGDHFVTTYQPQWPEGTIYEKDFEAPKEVENPAIKMWVRGLVPPENVSIDYVKLFINDELLGYINEYAVGTGSINDIDDEVEIEVSIEENILTEGTNGFKIVTGWGSSIYDRDDIMFWNIRLVRAQPLEISCNLLTPGPGDVHHVGLDTEEITLLVWNDRHVDALQWVHVIVDPDGAGTGYRWTQQTNWSKIDLNATQFADFPSEWTWASKDLHNRTWTLTARMSFLWTFPSEGPIDIVVRVRDDQTRMHVFRFDDVLEVKTRLEMSGPVSLIGAEQGALGPGSWVRGGEDVSATVPPLIYIDSGNVFPPPGTFSLSLSWESNELIRSSTTPGETWSNSWRVPMVARQTATVTIRAVDLPKGGKAPPPVVITLEVDGQGPNWLQRSPTEGEWLTDGTVETWADLTDGDGSGPDPFSVEFQRLDPVSNTWTAWRPAQLLIEGGVGDSSRAIANLELSEAVGHAIRWRVYDMVGNGPSISESPSFGVDERSVVIEPLETTGWIMSTEVFVACHISDPDPGIGASGVDISSIELSVLVSGVPAWTNWTVQGSVEPVVGTDLLKVTSKLSLADGGENYVRWRATDLAGNPVTMSPPMRLLVDTGAPKMVSYWPKGTTFDEPEEARAVASFTDDGGSGVNLSRVEYSVSVGNNRSFGDWMNAIVTDPAEDVARADVPVTTLSGHDNWIRWRVWDEVGNGPAEYGPFRLMVNLPPSAAISSPAHGSTSYATQTVRFSSVGTSDPDADDLLSFEWWSDVDGWLGTGPEIYAPLSNGNHRITLRVDDGLGGDHAVEAWVEVQVVERTDVREPISVWLILVIIIASVVVVATLREFNQRRRRRLNGLD